MRGIVSLVPSMTEILFCLGLGTEIVGVTEHCDFPETAKTKHRVGTFGQPEFEKIVALKPDLVVADEGMHAALADELRDFGIEVLAATPGSVQAVLDLMDKIGQLRGIAAQVEPIIDGFRQQVENLRSKALGQQPRVLRLMHTDHFIMPGPSSWQYDAIAIAGGQQMAVAGAPPYVRLAWEQIVRFDPEIILLCGIGPGQEPPARCTGCSIPKPVCQRLVTEVITKEWEVLSAVRQDRVYPIACHTICRPGPRLFTGMEILADKYFRK